MRPSRDRCSEPVDGPEMSLEPLPGDLQRLTAILQPWDEAISALRRAGRIDELDERIIGEICKRHGPERKLARIANDLGVHRTTISRRWRRIVAELPELERLGKSATRQGKPLREDRRTAELVNSLNALGLARSMGIPLSELPDSILAPVRGLLDRRGGIDLLDGFLRLLRAERDGEWARALRPGAVRYQVTARPGSDTAYGGTVEILDGDGPLPADIQEGIRRGVYRLVGAPLRCRTCGRFIRRSRTGRPPKFCPAHAPKPRERK